MNEAKSAPAVVEEESESHRWMAKRCKQRARQTGKVVFVIVEGPDEDVSNMFILNAAHFRPLYGQSIDFVAYPPGWKFRPKRNGANHESGVMPKGVNHAHRSIL